MRTIWLAGLASVALALFATTASAATITVARLTDSNFIDDGCSLRDAVSSANSNSAVGECAAGTVGSDTIVLQGGQEYTLENNFPGPEDSNTQGDLDVTGTTTITTSGSGLATISGNVGRAANLRDRVIQVFPSSGGLTLQNLRIRSGLAQAGASGGGGILSDAPLTIINSEITGNQVQIPGFSAGGGILVRGPQGTLTMTGSTVAGNTATAVGPPSANESFGGGIAVYPAPSAATITNSTISGNTASGPQNGTGFVGGLAVGDGGNQIPLNLTHTTITGNQATGINALTGGLQIVGPGTMTGNVVTGNTDAGLMGDPYAPDCFGGGFTSAGANVIGNIGTFGCSGLNGPGDLVGTTASPVIGGLGTLVNNGGLTRTHELNPGSPAINRGGTCPATDQRGFFRAPAAPCDSGAFEVGATTSPLGQPIAGVTGQRDAALKKCKKKHSHKKRKKCRKKANLLPL